MYGPCSIVPARRREPVSFVIEDDTSTDFSRRIMPAAKKRRIGDPLLSMMAGTLSILIAIVNLSALIGLGPESIPGLAVRVTIYTTPPVDGRGGVTTPGSWFVPEGDFFVLATLALTLSAVGIVLSRNRGLPIMSLIGFGLNTIALIAGFILSFTNFQYWG